MTDLEAEFRRRFVAALKTQSLCEYMASMNKAGVPDVHIVVEGRAHWIELKAVDKLPVRGTSNILGHRFTGTQISFLNRVHRRGGVGVGVIGFRGGDGWKCVVIRTHNIGEDGTVTRQEFERHKAMDLGSMFGPRFITLINRI